MIWVLAGTLDGAMILSRLKEAGFVAVASATTEYGMQKAREAGAVYVAGAMDAVEMEEFIRSRRISAVVDATHPFAINASVNAIKACDKLGVPYLRYERPTLEVTGEEVHLVDDFYSAGRRASALGEVIFYTGGTRNMETFLGGCNGKRVIARVLNEAGNVDRCLELGLKREDIIAAIPPFSKEDNLEMFLMHKADVLVTKETSGVGGFMEKVEAARELGMEIVVIRRPTMGYPVVVDNYRGVVKWIRKNVVSSQSSPRIEG